MSGWVTKADAEEHTRRMKAADDELKAAKAEAKRIYDEAVGLAEEAHGADVWAANRWLESKEFQK